MSDESNAILEGINWGAISGDPNSIPDGKYPGRVSKAKVTGKSKPDRADGVTRNVLILTYQVTEGPHRGKSIDDWKTLPQLNSETGLPKSEEDVKVAEWLKQRLLQIGVPEDRLSSTGPNDLVGMPIEFTVKQNGNYRNVNWVNAREESDGDFSSLI